MDYLESHCLYILKTKHNCVPLIYYKYVDDTIPIARKDHINLIVNIFDSYHTKLQFARELQVNNQINFLDVTLIIRNNKINNNWFQKLYVL